jgi:hypothetical protein
LCVGEPPSFRQSINCAHIYPLAGKMLARQLILVCGLPQKASEWEPAPGAVIKQAVAIDTDA